MAVATGFEFTVRNEITPPIAASPAQTRRAAATRPVSTAAGRVVSRCTTAGRTATASRPASRAAALFTPDATPSSASSTDASTVEVSGATVQARPRPNTTTAGSTVVRY